MNKKFLISVDFKSPLIIHTMEKDLKNPIYSMEEHFNRFHYRSGEEYT